MTIGAAVISTVSVLLMWYAQQLPTVCPAVYPAPASCSAEARLYPAIWGTVIVVSLCIATFIAVARSGATQRGAIVSKWLLGVLGTAAVIAPLCTLGASGFIV